MLKRKITYIYRCICTYLKCNIKKMYVQKIRTMVLQVWQATIHHRSLRFACFRVSANCTHNILAKYPFKSSGICFHPGTSCQPSYLNIHTSAGGPSKDETINLGCKSWSTRCLWNLKNISMPATCPGGYLDKSRLPRRKLKATCVSSLSGFSTIGMIFTRERAPIYQKCPNKATTGGESTWI